MVTVSRSGEKQRKTAGAGSGSTRIPGAVQARFEAASGLSFEDVRVHYHAPEPAQIGACAYTRGNQVYIGPGQERYLEHELGHVLQQKRGQVKPDGSIGGLPVNRDPALERAADAGADQPVRGIGQSGGEAVQMSGRGPGTRWGNKAWEEEEWRPSQEPEEEEEEDLEDGPEQVHHYATDKSSVYTDLFQAIVSRYGLDLDGDWNKEVLPHQGRHPNEYHEFVLEKMREIDKVADGDCQTFLRLFKQKVKKVVRDNPGMLYSEYWREG